jgi:glycosyltransferase involved in cell wall biosynthesis
MLTKTLGKFTSEARPRVSLCMIVRNEEKNLRGCIECAADLVDEIILVDTGSTDRTKEIAAELGARIFDFPWIDDFAAARNESLRHASGDWVFWLDADDRIDETNRQRLAALFQGLPKEKVGFAMGYSCLLDSIAQTRMRVDQIRLFPNDPLIRWTHRVHEQILLAIKNAGGEGSTHPCLGKPSRFDITKPVPGHANSFGQNAVQIRQPPDSFSLVRLARDCPSKFPDWP